MIIHEDKKVRIEFDATVPCVCWTPLDFMNSEEFRNSFNIGTNFFVQKIKEVKNLSWLNDTRLLVGAKPDDIKWLDDNVNRKCFLAGIKKVAFVLPEKPMGRMGIRIYAFMTSKSGAFKDMEVKAFEAIDDARAWLKGSVVQAKEIRLAINQAPSLDGSEV